MPVIVPNYSSMFYDGTNPEAIVEWLPNVELVAVSADGTIELSATAFGYTYSGQVPVGSWALQGAGLYQGSMTPEDYHTQYYELPGT